MKKGEVVVIIGPSGSGKSTLLKVFLGELKISKGVFKKGDFSIGYFDQQRRMLDDSKNIFLAISARAIDESIEIVSITQKHDTIHKLKAAGAKTVIDPYQISGKRIYEIIKKPD